MKILKSLILLQALYIFLMPKVEGLKVGDIAPNFSLKNVDGKMVSLETGSNIKGYIVVFTSNSCPYSILYEDRLIALNTKYESQGYPLIAIQSNNPTTTSGDSFEEMKERATQKGFNFPYLMDADGQATVKAFGATNTPQVYILNKEDARFKVAYIGAIDNNSRNPLDATKRYVENALDQLLAGLPVETPNTKAIGCVIKH
ncbi:MAG: thioredoxin family protein [Cytophagales bacterium CG12_big_fil_rev_8_21_14_0_65_40_12]|nr:MAG: thioredoxin family protein [Cytophagales bacterium CG12_big_fil_rev_8_21_14_0_65_40_12]PIW05087.1 MAG: thioredoxin family protein [Cytophagales bacterium CG17_big_fil_post_rev_8_21_14_2_50_40_13]